TLYSRHIELFLTGGIKWKLGYKEIESSQIRTHTRNQLVFRPNYNSGKVPTLKFLEIMPATKEIASFKLPTTTLARYQVQYFHDHATVTSAIGLNQSPTVDVITTVGSRSFDFGAKAGHNTSAGALTKTSGVAEVCRKFSTNENTITVGGLYAVDPLTSAKYRLSNRGKFAALIQVQIVPCSQALSDRLMNIRCSLSGSHLMLLGFVDLVYCL
ncbi:hypothetical protein MKW98_031043, partial [Papaver atlanticum]